jgi:CBS domain-containing protein
MKLPAHGEAARLGCPGEGADHRINQLPVVQDEKLVGIVTDPDLRDAPEAFAISSQPIDTDTPAVLPDPVEIHVEDVVTVAW